MGYTADGWKVILKVLTPEQQIMISELIQEKTELLEESQRLKDQIRKLEQEKNIKDKMQCREFRSGKMMMKAWFRSDKQGPGEGPYCPVCYGNDFKLMLLQQTPTGHYCPYCTRPK